MKKFMVLYQSPVNGRERMEQASPEQMKASMDEWIAWRAKVGEDKLEFGSPLNVGKLIANGHVSDGKMTVSGYSIVQADDLDAATELLKDHPVLKTPGTSIEILEFLDMPGIDPK